MLSDQDNHSDSTCCLPKSRLVRGNTAALLLPAVLICACGPVSGSSDLPGAAVKSNDASLDEVGIAEVFQTCGVDSRVDYESLLRFGPWDDRNYQLTADDLKHLSPNEHELHDAIPAFFRVELRKEMPGMPRSGPVQYPRAAVPLFSNRYGSLQQIIKKESDCRATN